MTTNKTYIVLDKELTKLKISDIVSSPYNQRKEHTEIDLSEYLQVAGQLLYGNQWFSQMTMLLQVSERTLRRWLKGQEPKKYGKISRKWIEDKVRKEVELKKVRIEEWLMLHK